EEGRQLLVTLKKDTPALGGYRLKDKFAAIRNVPVGPKELHVLGRFGGILALTGDQKITVKSRNLSSLRYKLGRVPPEQVNHLVSQTSGDFRKPRFGSRFNETNFAHFAEQTQSVFLENSFEANFNTFDLAPHIASEDPFDLSRGLFFLRVNGWDPKEGKYIKAGGDAGDQAFVLITDLGIVAKVNQDRTRDVFVQSLATGSPVEGAKVQVLGKNGIAVASALTGPQGRAALPAVDERRRDEKQPVAIIVRKEADLSFMPLNRYQHHVSFSRFDVGGITAATAGDLDGFVFTERGIYRPGDKIHAGVIIKPRDWEGRLEGVPIKVSVTDVRNKTVMENIISLPDSGFADFECETDYGSPTGEYKLWAYLVHEEKDGKRPDDTLLASTTVRVEEFLPDTMKVKTNVTPESGNGWVPPLNLTAAVDVQNLYGTPATERKVTGSVTAAPISFAFDEYPDYVFFDRNVKTPATTRGQLARRKQTKTARPLWT
ncbi:MAG: MG2 domain-containing protein, partial [Verrucomicrobiota bacterium]